MSPTQISRSSWMSLALVAALAGLVGATEPAAEPAPADSREASMPAAGESGGAAASPREAATVPGSAGLRALVDPDTGELRSGSGLPDAAARPRPDQWLNTYSRDLIEEAVPQGGFMVDLQGRFQSAVVATVDPVSGEVVIDCVDGPAAGGTGDDE